MIVDFLTVGGLDAARQLEIPVIVNNPFLLPAISTDVLPPFPFVPSLLSRMRSNDLSIVQAFVFSLLDFVAKPILRYCFCLCCYLLFTIQFLELQLEESSTLFEPLEDCHLSTTLPFYRTL
jgi:hypothetical protein